MFILGYIWWTKKFSFECMCISDTPKSYYVEKKISLNAILTIACRVRSNGIVLNSH